jgi:DivIVA domain-containing protein
MKGIMPSHVKTPVPRGREFKGQWRSLPLAERLRIRWAVSRGRTLKDPRRAALAAALARHWLASPWLRPAGITLQLVIVAVLVAGVLVVVPPDRRWVIFVGLVLGIGGALSAPQVFRRAERANREIAEGRGSSQTTDSREMTWAAGMQGQRFRRHHGGYKIEEVDAFFARVEGQMVTAREIEDVTFRLTWWKPGYDPREVDDALDQAKSVAPPNNPV